MGDHLHTPTLLTLAAMTFGAALGGAPFISSARAANELCGQTITQSVTLTADQACTGDGLIVSGDGITIDLGGFTLSGDGDAGDNGIDVSAARHLTIRNGTIRHFNFGVASAVGVPELVKLSQVTVRDNVSFGVAATAGTLILDKCSVINNGVGLGVETETLKITSTAFVANATDGLQFDTDFATIANVVSSGNGRHGLTLFGGARKIAIQSSTFARNAMVGVFIADSDTDTAAGTVKLAKSTIIGNAGDGVRTDGISDSQHFVSVAIVGNVIEGNGGSGVNLTRDSDGNVVSGNRIIGNGADGVTVDASSDATVVKGNTIVGNSGSGIATANATATVAKNTTNANSGRGIFAPGGAVDGGGNKARANGGQPCSTGITCPAAFTPTPGPVTPTCGMHVTTSITLGADTPLCVALNGMFIDADDVTVNLNGHTIHGDRSADTTGISMTLARKHVTITNGIIQGFERGIDNAINSDGLKIVNVEVRDCVLHGADLRGNAVVVSKSVFVRNSGDGLVLGDFSLPKVSGSFFVGNNGNGIVASAPTVTITDVVSAVNLRAGVRLEKIGSGKLEKSILAANGEDGLRIDDAFGFFAPATVKKNVMVGNQMDGIALDTNSIGLVVDSNVSGGNDGRGIGVTKSPNLATLKKNRLIGNVGDGLFVDTSVETTVLVQNSAVGNGGSGLNVDTATSTLAKNIAVGNLLRGINTPFGATDGGGNKAHDNVAPEQCTPPIICP